MFILALNKSVGTRLDKIRLVRIGPGSAIKGFLLFRAK